MFDEEVLDGGQVTVGHRFLEDSEVKGLLFDCDGTLLDSMPLFYHSWVTVCPEFGLAMSEADFYGYAGMPLPDIVRDLHIKQTLEITRIEAPPYQTALPDF